MSWPVTGSGAAAIETRPAYVEHCQDAAMIAARLSLYKPSQPATESGIMPQTSAALERFSTLEHQLRLLMNSVESDEFGPVRPTPESVGVARKALFQLVQAGFGLPPAVETGTDHDGALRLVWENGPRFLELVVPREDHAAAYFYYSQGDEYNLQRDLSLDGLRQRFNWLTANAAGDHY